MVRSPYLGRDIAKPERVQRAATRWTLTQRDVNYEGTHKKGLLTLYERRKRGDMVMLYNYIIERVTLDMDDFMNLNTRRAKGRDKG